MGENVRIGPYSVIEQSVRIGDDTEVGNHTTITGVTTLGKRCQIYHNCSIGERPQDLKYAGEPTETRIGDEVVIREAVTINRGTAAHGCTEIGNRVLLMAYVHVAHDCQIADHVIFANLVTLGGHVEVDEWASLGGGVLVHQFCKVGAHVFVGGGYRIVQDVPPFILTAGDPLRYKGINRVGLERHGFSPADRTTIKKMYRILYRSGLPKEKALDIIRNEFSDNPQAQSLIEFIGRSNRGLI